MDESSSISAAVRCFLSISLARPILELIEHGWDEASIAEEISRSYAMSIEVVRTDVHDFIKALRQHEILRANDSVDLR